MRLVGIKPPTGVFSHPYDTRFLIDRDAIDLQALIQDHPKPKVVQENLRSLREKMGSENVEL